MISFENASPPPPSHVYETVLKATQSVAKHCPACLLMSLFVLFHNVYQTATWSLPRSFLFNVCSTNSCILATTIKIPHSGSTCLLETLKYRETPQLKDTDGMKVAKRSIPILRMKAHK